MGEWEELRLPAEGFRRDVESMRRALEDGLGSAAERAGARIEGALARAVRTGKFGFEELKATALGVLGDIAAAAVRDGVGAVLGGLGLPRGAGGLPGRATGGPVAPGRAYLVGERGPELFVPTSSGRVETGAPGGSRQVNVTVRVEGGGGAPERLARSARQVARAVKSALQD